MVWRAVLCRVVVATAVAVGSLAWSLGAPLPLSAEVNEALPERAIPNESLALGQSHACVVLDDASVRCWGAGLSGQIGSGVVELVGDEPGEMGDALDPVDLGAGERARAVTAGLVHTCALLEDGQVKCWGGGATGALGNGSAEASIGDEPGEMGVDLPAVDLGSDRVAVAVTAGSYHTCALLEGGSVVCWGQNDQGQLGDGTTANRGDEPAEMGDALPLVDLPTGRTAVSISAGSFVTCALLDNGSVVCWGAGADGALGNGSPDDVGDGPGEMGDDLVAVDLGTGRTARSISAGAGVTCAVLDDATVKCWGLNNRGQLGTPGVAGPVGDGPGEMGDALPAVDLGTGRTALGVAVGSTHVCALLDGGDLKCWGEGRFGGLGQGSTAGFGLVAGSMGVALPPIDLGTGLSALAVSAGQWFTCAVVDDGSLKCWGRSGGGATGLETTNSIGDGADEMGDALPTVQLGTGRFVGRTALAVDLTVDDTDVEAGQLVTFDIAVRNPGSKPLTGVSAELDAGVCSETIGDLAALATVTFECTAVFSVADVPSRVVEVSVVADGGLSASDSVSVAVDDPFVPVPGVEVSLSATPSRVTAGDVIEYVVTVRNFGNIDLTGVTVSSPEPDCNDSIGDLAVGESHVGSCSVTTSASDVPSKAVSVSVSAVEGGSGSASVTTPVDPAEIPVVVRPDGLIRVGSRGVVRGNGVYNSTGQDQAVSRSVGLGRTARYSWRIQNDGNTARSFRLAGTAGSRRFGVVYRVGASDVTAAVVAGTFSTVRLAPGAGVTVTVEVTPRRSSSVGSSRALLLTARSSGVVDTVRAVTTRT